MTGPSSFVQSSKMVLLVEDDVNLRSLLSMTLTAQGFIVREAENGLVARTIFDIIGDKLSLVISDVRLPELDGVLLLSHIRKSSWVPFILMTGFSELIESKQAYELGANEFLTKPFGKQPFLEAIDAALNPEPKQSAGSQPKSANDPAKYCAIDINEFITSTKLLSDIYVKVGEKKYIKVAYEGDILPVERLMTYRDKKVDVLYVTLDDFSRYVDFNIKLTKAALSQKSFANEKKAHLLRHTAQSVIKECFEGQLDAGLLGPAENIISSTIGLIATDDELLDVFVGLHSHSDKLYAQGVAVSLISCLVAKLHGWHATQTLFKISVAGLFHDIGLKEIDKSLINKRRSHRTSEETKLLESHPVRGRDLLMEIKSLHEDIPTIVHQHHESLTGTGYPRQIRGEAIHPIARLIATVDKLVVLLIPLEDGVSPLSHKEALHSLLVQKPDECDRAFLLCLAKLLDYNVTEAERLLKKAS